VEFSGARGAGDKRESQERERPKTAPLLFYRRAMTRIGVTHSAFLTSRRVVVEVDAPFAFAQRYGKKENDTERSPLEIGDRQALLG
jgi:hypothetical protein